MNIIFLTISRLTDISSRGIYTDLMRKFRDEGHQVYIVSPAERQFNKPTSLTEENGVHFLKVRTLNIQKTNFIEKGIATLLIEYQFNYAINHYLGDIKFDLILYSTPPITFTKVIKSLKRKNKAISYLLLKDIFPQNAVDIQLFSKKNPLYWLFRNKEKQLYKVSDYIGCMSPANVDFVLRHNLYISPDRVEVNPNCAELSLESDCRNKTEVRRKYNLPIETPVFIYGGNLGKPQGLDFLLRVLESNNKRNDCYFLVVGSGTQYAKIARWFELNKPANAQLLTGLPRDEYTELVCSCDVGLIFLDPRFTIPNYPSRLLSYLENKMPVLAATDINTDIGRIAEANGYGLWCESGDLKTFNHCLNRLLEKKTIQIMGERGYLFLKENYQVDYSYQIIMNHFK